VTPKSKHEAAGATMRQINPVGDGQGRKPCTDAAPEIVMASPNFTGRIQGQEKFLAGFRDFCQAAPIESIEKLP
jgi:hypothetical protein